MTKNKANSTIKWLDVQCDDYLFATKVGVAGCMSSMRVKGDWTVVLAFLITAIGDVLARLNAVTAAVVGLLVFLPKLIALCL